MCHLNQQPVQTASATLQASVANVWGAPCIPRSSSCLADSSARIDSTAAPLAPGLQRVCPHAPPAAGPHSFPPAVQICLPRPLLPTPSICCRRAPPPSHTCLTHHISGGEYHPPGQSTSRTVTPPPPTRLVVSQEVAQQSAPNSPTKRTPPPPDSSYLRKSSGLKGHFSGHLGSNNTYSSI
jgi:hypothetical protein